MEMEMEMEMEMRMQGQLGDQASRCFYLMRKKPMTTTQGHSQIVYCYLPEMRSSAPQ